MYSSMTTWALFPVIPKLETPARRGVAPSVFHSCTSVLMNNGDFFSWIIGFNSLKFGILGIVLFFIDNMTLITLANPAAPSKWPIWALVEPIAQKFVFLVYSLNAFLSALISMGSPNSVPVP